MASRTTMPFARSATNFVCRACRETQLRNLSTRTRSGTLLRQGIRHRLPQRLQKRDFTLFDQRTRSYWHGISRQHPVMLPLAVALIGVLGTTTAFYLYGLIRIRLSMAQYPEEVDMLIRQGVKFTEDKNLDGESALKAWGKALNLALTKYQMHPMSDEVIFIYLRYAHSLEKFGLSRQAIGLLEDYKQLCILHINEKYKDKPEHRGDRTRVLDTAIKTSVQLGGLYAKPSIANRQKSEEHLVWAVETALKEQARREQFGTSEGQDDWLDSDQIGAMLESLGRHYEENNQHYFASQLFIRALTLKKNQDCHTVVLMNNIATSLAQSVPPAEPGLPPPSRSQLCDSASSWASKSLEIARTIKPPLRNEECDVGCTVATHNLGEFAEMVGNLTMAKDLYEEAGSLAHALGFEEGVVAAEAGLKRLTTGKHSSAGGAWFDQR